MGLKNRSIEELTTMLLEIIRKNRTIEQPTIYSTGSGTTINPHLTGGQIPGVFNVPANPYGPGGAGQLYPMNPLEPDAEWFEVNSFMHELVETIKEDIMESIRQQMVDEFQETENE